MSTENPGRPGRGRAPKRAAVLDAARVVFGRQGYSRTSIDAIASEAAVSTRTIYNHFEGKDQLFNAVLLASAARVADSFVDGVARGLAELSPEPDVRAELEVIGRAVVAHTADNPEHFALVRQIRAEADHVPEPVLAGWRKAGPLRVNAEVVAQLTRLAARGLLRIDDPARAALHFIALVQAEAELRPTPERSPLEPPADRAEAVAAGVRVFLHGYAR
jgi:AcrR family transcriptional regulator